MQNNYVKKILNCKCVMVVLVLLPLVYAGNIRVTVPSIIGIKNSQLKVIRIYKENTFSSESFSSGCNNVFNFLLLKAKKL